MELMQRGLLSAPMEIKALAVAEELAVPFGLQEGRLAPPPGRRCAAG